jgi:hypothetical protein
MESPTRNQHCPVCKASMGLLSKKVKCSSCKQLVCRDHSVLHENSNHFCDICEKNIIKAQSFPDVSFHISSLQSDLAYLEKDKNKYRNEILTKNDIITRLEKQNKANAASYNEKLENLEKKIAQEKNKIVSEEKLIVHLKQSLLECEKSENAMLEKLNFLMSEVHNSKIEYQELEENQQFLLDKIYEINVELRLKVPIPKLTQEYKCNTCLPKLKKEFMEAFQTAFILEGRDSFASFADAEKVTEPRNEVITSSVCKRCIIN